MTENQGFMVEQHQVRINQSSNTVDSQLIAQKLYQNFPKKCDKLRYFQYAI